MTLIDPMPMEFSDGDILSVFAVGDGVNQAVGAFTWPSNQVGFLLSLVRYKVYMPIIIIAA